MFGLTDYLIDEATAAFIVLVLFLVFSFAVAIFAEDIKRKTRWGIIWLWAKTFFKVSGTAILLGIFSVGIWFLLYYILYLVHTFIIPFFRTIV